MAGLQVVTLTALYCAEAESEATSSAFCANELILRRTDMTVVPKFVREAGVKPFHRASRSCHVRGLEAHTVLLLLGFRDVFKRS